MNIKVLSPDESRQVMREYIKSRLCLAKIRWEELEELGVRPMHRHEFILQRRAYIKAHKYLRVREERYDRERGLC